MAPFSFNTRDATAATTATATSELTASAKEIKELLREWHNRKHDLLELEIRIGSFDNQNFKSTNNSKCFYDLLNILGSSNSFKPVSGIDGSANLTSEYRTFPAKYTSLYLPNNIRVESFESKTDNSPPLVTVEQKQRVNSVDLVSFGYRVGLSSEINLGTKIPPEANTPGLTNRHKTRWSFVATDPSSVLSYFRIDLARVTNPKNTSSSFTTYEIELELLKLPKKVGEIHDAVLEIMRIMQGTVDTSLVMFPGDIANAIFRYNSMFTLEIQSMTTSENTKRKYLNSWDTYPNFNKPINIKIQQLGDPSLTQWLAVTDKAHGERGLLMLDSGYGYIVHPTVSKISRLFKLSSRPLLQRPSLIDCEIIETFDSFPTILAFDILFSNGVDLRNKTLPERLELLAFVVRSEQLPVKVKYFEMTPELTVFQKASVVLDATKLMSYANDGLILNDIRGNYHSTVYKWKPPAELTIDFTIEKLDGAKNGNIRVFKLLSKDQTKLVPFLGTERFPTKGTYAATNLDLESGMVVEFSYDTTTQKFVFVRIRNERQQPNGIDVARSVWEDIHKPLTEDMIRGTIPLFNTADPFDYIVAAEGNAPFEDRDRALDEASRKGKPVGPVKRSVVNRLVENPDDDSFVKASDLPKRILPTNPNPTLPKSKNCHLNPHSHQVLLNPAAGYVCHTNIPFTRVLTDTNYPVMEYHRRKGEVKTVIHWGQRKLLMSEIEFLTLHGKPDSVVIYAGAAPGTHMGMLSDMFPEINFVLVDPAPFTCKETKRIKLVRGLFTDELARQFTADYKGKRLLFISDIRSVDYNTDSPETVEEKVLWDMNAQMAWHMTMKPARSMLKFRLPWYTETTEYLDGDLYLPVWGPITTTEGRLITHEYSTKTKLWNNKKYEGQMFYFNTVARPALYAHDIANCVGIDHCYDCRSEVEILTQYIAKYTPTENVSKKICEMSTTISKKISANRTLEDPNLDPEERRRGIVARQYTDAGIPAYAAAAKTSTSNETRSEMRLYHNAVKKEMINAVRTGAQVLDIGGGRGGDIAKWHAARQKVLAIEPDKSNISEFYNRLSSSKMYRLDKDIWVSNNGSVIGLVLGFGQDHKRIEEELAPWFNSRVHGTDIGSKKSFDVVELFNVLTFFYQSPEMMNGLMRTIDSNLKIGGVFMGLMMDGERVVKMLNGKQRVETPEWSIVAKNELGSNNSPYGNTIEIDIAGSIVDKQTEYLTNFSELKQRLTEIGMELVETTFLDNPSLSSVAQQQLSGLFRKFVFKRVNYYQPAAAPNKNIVKTAKSTFSVVPHTLLRTLSQNEKEDIIIKGMAWTRIWSNSGSILEAIVSAATEEYRSQTVKQQQIVLKTVAKKIFTEEQWNKFPKEFKSQFVDREALVDAAMILENWDAMGLIKILGMFVNVNIVIVTVTPTIKTRPAVTTYIVPESSDTVVFLCNEGDYEALAIKRADMSYQTVFKDTDKTKTIINDLMNLG